jgi:hypothetical protein
MSDIDLIADAREWLATQSDRPQTHGETCHRWHPACLVSRLVRLIDSRTGQNDHQGENMPERERTPCQHATPGECSVQPDESTLLREAIRRLAEQDATLSVINGNVIVEIDATLTDAEREAIAFMLRHAAVAADGGAFIDSAEYRQHHDAVFGLLARTSACGNRQ